MQINQEQRRKIDIDDRGNPLMTLKTIKYYCYKESLYETPELNEKLYLHFKGFKSIQSLDNYPNLVTVWLNNNCISKIEGLSGLTKLICLYLNNNVISRIQNLEGLHQLSVLHLAHNRIDKIEGLRDLKVLNILNVSQNFLTSADSLHGLSQSESLTSIDMSKNELENSDQVFNFVSSLSNISCLCMKNTPISKAYKNYRKKLIGALKNLQYLDDRPVKHIDHRLAQAWLKGGAQQQNTQRGIIADENQQKNVREHKQLSEKIKREMKREEQIKALEKQKRLLQEDNQNEFKNEFLQELDRRLQILRDGPKGFQACITETSIKILHVSELEQEKIINKYFYNEKLKIEDNIRKMSDQKISVQEISMGEDEKIIQTKIRRILNLNSKHEGQFMESWLTKWNSKYEPILQALLQKEKYNFENVLPQFNKIFQEINKKMMRSGKKFEARELQHIWYQIMASRCAPQQKE